MLNSAQKSTGFNYTFTVALLVVAFIFTPALLAISWPIGYFALALAVASSLLCTILAWVNWTKGSQLSIPTLERQRRNNE